MVVYVMNYMTYSKFYISYTTLLKTNLLTYNYSMNFLHINKQKWPSFSIAEFKDVIIKCGSSSIPGPDNIS